MRAVALLAPCVLAACSAWPSGSYVRSVSPADAAVLAPAITGYLTSALPAQSAVAVATAQAADSIGSILTAELAQDGFTQSPSGLPIDYVAAPLDGGLLLRISISGSHGASQYFARDAEGTIRPAGPLTVAQP